MCMSQYVLVRVQLGRYLARGRLRLPSDECDVVLVLTHCTRAIVCQC